MEVVVSTCWDELEPSAQPSLLLAGRSWADSGTHRCLEPQPGYPQPPCLDRRETQYIYIYWQILVVYACGNFVQRKQACDGWRFSWESSMTPALQVFDRAAYLRGFETTYWDVIFVQGGRHHLHCFDWTTWYSLNICQTLWPFFWSSWKWDTPADTATLCYTCPFGVGTLLFRVGVLARVCVCVCQFSKRPFCSKRSPGAGTKAGSPRMWAVDFRCLQF